MGGLEAGTQGLGDPFGPPGDLLPGVLVDRSTGVLEFVAALCIAGSLGWGAVALAAGDLDDNAGIVEQEVHAGERAAITSMDHLGARPRHTGLAYELEEAALEHRVPARVDEKVVEQAGAPASGSAQAPSRSTSTTGDERPVRMAESIAASRWSRGSRNRARSMIVRVADVHGYPSTTARSIGGSVNVEWTGRSSLA